MQDWKFFMKFRKHYASTLENIFANSEDFYVTAIKNNHASLEKNHASTIE